MREKVKDEKVYPGGNDISQKYDVVVTKGKINKYENENENDIKKQNNKNKYKTY